MEPLREPVNSIDRHIGRRIRIRRQLLRMSSAEAAARLGVPEAVFAEYEAGLLRLDARSLLRLVGVLDVRLRFFFDGIVTVEEAHPAARRVND
jgi:transcriptional regulator with XRE-family HTH domain